MRERQTRDYHRPLRTADVARESGYSVQQVRDLERLGVIPPAVRAANGYRTYGPAHVRALRAYRGLAVAAGPVEARRLLAELFAEPRAGSLADAAAAIGVVHVRLARERDEALRAQEALSAIQAEAAVPDGGGADDGATAAGSAGADTMTITELAGALGVRTSTLRFWEQEGLAVPQRVTTLRARQYGPAAVREARIVTALRSSGYGIPAVQDVVATLHRLEGISEGITEARQILDGRLDQIAARTIALLRAGADLAVIIDPIT
ncbi:DNA-binding transcriptional MerR regulator [Promicromonospora sp. AC04]|uniref:MerR family transcriptional regulator n=1 Tax=Promicromonospora sp. AC04 TaxID=2135723 RepID=UPI000D35A490|nr:MerR family transcriptional regulator [Promicromonospora sp. AC04]PUB28669.1 DNA-binding transcriptional MerR regulator [Promicromonospora sp. AC04]